MKKISPYIVLLILLCFCPAGCRKDESDTMQMDWAESVIMQYPDSALSILTSIDSTSLKGKAEAARYALLKSMAIDKTGVDLITFAVLKPAIDYYTTHGTPDQKLRTYYYQARIFQNRDEWDNAFLFYKKAEKLYPQVTDTLTLCLNLIAQGTIYHLMTEFDSVISNNLKAAKLYHELGENEKEGWTLIRALGGGIQKENAPLCDSLISLFRKLPIESPILKRYADRKFLVHAIWMGDSMAIRSQIDRVESSDAITEEIIPDLALAYSRVGDSATAERLLENVTIVDSIKYYFIRAEIYEKSGHYSEALDAKNEYVNLMVEEEVGILERATSILKDEFKLELENERIAYEKKRNVIISISCILTVAFLLLLSFYRLKKLSVQKKYHAALLEKSKAELGRKDAEIKRNEAELKEAETLRRNNELEIENLRLTCMELTATCSNLEKLSENREDLSPELHNVLIKYIENFNKAIRIGLVEAPDMGAQYKKWSKDIIENKGQFVDEIITAFKLTHPGFLEHLQNFPLTPEEIGTIYLHAIGMQTNELNWYCTPRDPYRITQEIRKKMGITSKHFKTVLNQLLAQFKANQR